MAMGVDDSINVPDPDVFYSAHPHLLNKSAKRLEGTVTSISNLSPQPSPGIYKRNPVRAFAPAARGTTRASGSHDPLRSSYESGATPVISKEGLGPSSKGTGSKGTGFGSAADS